jgi:RNA polymerase sigma-70 factor (ECF subfamily)
LEDHEFSERIVAMTDTLYRVCYAQLYNERDREDAVQECLCKAWQNRDKLREGRYLQTWVCRILINECHNIPTTARPSGSVYL